ncbi:MAG: hypothetical protein ACLU4N_08345 [Butyricimonas faecihominis]
MIKEERRSRRNLGMRLREQTDPYVFNHSKYATRSSGARSYRTSHRTSQAYYKDFTVRISRP